MTESTLLQKYLQIFSVVAAYWFVSITLGPGQPQPSLSLTSLFQSS